MGYTLKIKADGFIDVDEWVEILESTKDFARIATREFVEINGPKPGEKLRFPVSEGSAEVFFPEENEWFVVFTYNDSGYITFRSPSEHTKDSPAWTAAAALATLLDGYIVGEGGERYDLNTGESVPTTEAEHLEALKREHPEDFDDESEDEDDSDDESDE